MPREERKYVDPKELRSEGFLQEVNRLFFHPLGLALSIVRWEESDIQKLIDAIYNNAIEKIRLTGDNREQVIKNLIRDAFAQTGIVAGEETILGVWDARHDPEGIIFEIEDEVDLAGFKEQADKVRHLREERAGARLILFKSGSPIQPLEVIRRNDPER